MFCPVNDFISVGLLKLFFLVRQFELPVVVSALYCANAASLKSRGSSQKTKIFMRMRKVMIAHIMIGVMYFLNKKAI